MCNCILLSFMDGKAHKPQECQTCGSFSWIPPAGPRGYCHWCIAEVSPEGTCGCKPSAYYLAKVQKESPYTSKEQAIRADVVDSILSYILDECQVRIDERNGERFFVISGDFPIVKLIKHLEGLRQGGEP